MATTPVTDLNVALGAIVRRNSCWDPEWGDEGIHPPAGLTGEVIGWTDRNCNITGEMGSADWDSIVRVRWEGKDEAKDLRIGFADEYWLELVSGGADPPREPPKPPIEHGGLFDEEPSGFGMCRQRGQEDPNGEPVAFVPTPAIPEELAAEPSLRLFWRVHAGDVEAVRALLSGESGLVDSKIAPFEFPDDDQFPWPYSHFAEAYGDSPAMLACRYSHSAMLLVLLEHGADTSLANDDGDTCATIAMDRSKLVQRAFSDENPAGVVSALGLSEGPEAVPALFPQSRCVRGSFCELSSCVAAGGDGVAWLLVNGHSDPEQVEYCESMVSEWRKTLVDRGDVIHAELYCPTKPELSEAVGQLFQAAAGGACGLFVICHGGKEAGEWVGFDKQDEDATFGWEDIEAAGLYGGESLGPAQLFVVGDSCYSAKMGKKGFAALRSRHLGGAQVPVCSMLMASDKPEKNFSCMFALEAMECRRKLSRATCEMVAQAQSGDEPALEIVEDITVETDDHDPFFFFYAPTDAISADSVIYTL